MNMPHSNTIHIPFSDTHPNDVLHGVAFLEAARAAGAIGIMGNIWPHHVYRGALILTSDDFGDAQWSWADAASQIVSAEVRLPDTGWVQNEIDYGFELMRKLRGARVPVIGRIWPRNVERGTLMTMWDQGFGEYVWTWSE